MPLEYQGAVIDPWGNERIGFEGSVVVNRKNWGLTWNAAIESGGVLVSEKVTLEFDISAIKRANPQGGVGQVVEGHRRLVATGLACTPVHGARHRHRQHAGEGARGLRRHAQSG